jgi:Zinc finger C-x8-C-x5-C-x3-H type (and similar)
MSETRSSKKAAEPSADQNEIDFTQEVLQTTVEDKSIVKAISKSPRIKSEKQTLELSDEEIEVIMAKRAGLSEALLTLPVSSLEDRRATLPRKETKPFDLKTLDKDKFTMTTILNKQRFEKFDRLLRANDLYTMATGKRLPPVPSASNVYGYSNIVVNHSNGKFTQTPADNVANYEYDLTRLETMIYTAFDKALYHQSQGFIDHDPVRMYGDLYMYFYSQDSHGIKAARVALDRYKINPAISLRADLTLFEEVIRNVEFAAEGVILDKIKLSIIDEKYNLDTRIGVRERLVHSQVNKYSYKETLDELNNVPNASVTPASNHRMMAFTPKTEKTEICNNHAKGRCTFGERCKYIHDSQPSSKTVSLKIIQDAAPILPSKKPPAPAGAPPKHKAVPPTYIEERHRSFMGQPTGLLSPTNPLGYSRKQYAVLKHLQVQESNDWNLPTAIRGPRDSNGNAYLGMFQCIQSPEPSTPLTPARTIQVQYRPPTPPLPRSAPYAEAHIRDSNVTGYNYEYLRSPTPVATSPEPTATETDTQNDMEEIYFYDHSAPRKRVLTEDAAEYLRKTIMVFHHCLRHEPLPRCFKGYISWVYDEKPDDPTKPIPYTRTVNILGWKSISPLHHKQAESHLPIYRGDPHVLELLQMIGNVLLHASTNQHPIDGVPLTAGSYNSFSPFSNTFNHQPDRGSYTSSVIAIMDYVYHFNTVFSVSPDDPTRPYLFLAIIYDFMAFTSQYYRRALNDEAPTPFNMKNYESKLVAGICTMAVRAVLIEGGQRDFDDFVQVFYAIAANACPIPSKVTDYTSTLYETPTLSRKRALADRTEAMFKVSKHDHGHDDSIPEEEEAELLFSPLSHPRPHSEIIDLSVPGYPSIPAPDDILDTDEVILDYFADIPMNALSATERVFIMDSGAGRTGTSDLSLLKNVKASTATTVTGAFGPTITASHTGSFGPHGLDAVYIKSMGPQTLVSLSQFCNAGNKYVGVFTDTEYRMYDRASAEPALKLLAANGREAERGNVKNGIYVRS